jgi:hypothetical protein
MSEHIYQNVHTLDLPWLSPAPRLVDSVTQGHAPARAYSAMKALVGAMGGDKQYRGCRDEQQPTRYAFQMCFEALSVEGEFPQCGAYFMLKASIHLIP